MSVVALIMGSKVRGFRSLAKSDLRASSAKMSGAVKYLFDRASTTGKHHRLVIDLAEGRYWAEVSDDKFYIPHEAETAEDTRRREEERRKQDERSNTRSSGDILPQTSSYDPTKLDVGDFRPKRARFAAFKETALKPMTLKNVKIRSVYTPRVMDPITSGRAYLYFFPLGQTEDAIITLSDESGETAYSLVIHPITGRVRIYDQEVRPSGGVQYDDEGKRVVQ